MHFSSLLLLAAAALPSSSAFAPIQHSAPHPASTALASSATNKNGVPFGQPDPEIKCAFFRILNPRTDKYVHFREDVDKGGLDADLADQFGWPMIYVQQGKDKALNEGAGLDTSDLDGYVDGVLSHQDLMWPHRAEIADLLKAREQEDGSISPVDLFDVKQFTAEKYGMKTPSFASYNEIPLIFLICGGDPDTGKVPLKSILDLFDGIPPSTRGRVNQEGMDKVNVIVTEAREASPNPLMSGLKSPGVFGKKGFAKMVKATVLVLTGRMKKKVLE